MKNNHNSTGTKNCLNFLVFQRDYTKNIVEKESNLKDWKKELTKKILGLLNKKIWPYNSELKLELDDFIEETQKDIAVKVKLSNKIDDKIKLLMKDYAMSVIYAITAIENISKNKGKKTPGIDNKRLETKEDKINLVKELSFKNLKSYKASPVRKIYILDPIKNKKKELGIPTIKDRCVQELFRLVLDPAIDVISDPDSYGFRKNRNCHMALGRVQKTLIKNPSHKTIIDADIKGFFDNLNHKWIINNFPFPTHCNHILEQWLTTEIFENKIVSYNEQGVPQGGIISPLIANYTLNGIEKKAFEGLRKYKPGIKNKVNYTDLTRSLIRYADDLVVIIGDIKEEYCSLVSKNIEDFLGERGLQLNKKNIIYLGKEDERGEVTPIEGKFNFLGFTYHYIPKPKISSFFNRKDLLCKDKIFVYPNRDKFKNFKKKIKEIIKRSKNLTAYQLIKVINPIITGWTNYYGLSTCAKTLSHLDNYIYRRLWVWIIKKYPRTSKVYLAEKFFKSEDIKSPVNRTWHFHGKLEEISNNLQKRRKGIIFIKFASKLNRIIALFKVALGPVIRTMSPYINKEEFIKHSLIVNKLRMVNKGYTDTTFLYNLQEGLCEYCNKPLFIYEDLSNSNTDVHHITPISIGGKDNTFSNKSLIHKECHKLIHTKFGYKQKTFLPYRKEKNNINKNTFSFSYNE